MKLYIAKDEYQNVCVYTSKKRMLREANANEFEVQEPIIFDLTKIGVLSAIREVVTICGTEVFIEIGDQND